MTTDSPGAFRRVRPTVDFPALDRRILDFWDSTDAFRRSVRMRPLSTEYVFYDGPPFASGSMHYGHLLQGVVKDMVPRYWTMRGHRVERRFGWDTHGLPVEMQVQQQLGVSGPKEIEAYGVAAFNEACRAAVENVAAEWYDTTARIGRWVDFDNDYKTMDVEFMESGWWAFKQLWDKGLIYREFKVLPYSWAATTPIANFEVTLGGYRDVDDPSITVRIRVGESSGPVDAGDYLLIWTTTPWTLPANLAVAVGREVRYVRVADDGEHYWIAEDRLSAVWPDEPLVVASALGSELIGASYEPPFGYFTAERARGAFSVIASGAVTAEEGTGLVHMAPAYGEDDFDALRDAGIPAFVDPVDAEARFTEEVPDVAGLHVKEADDRLIEMLDASGALVRSTRITHSYPFCPRTDTPLIYKAIPTWFIAVERIKDRMVELNEEIRWVPDYVGERRFGNWLADAKDYAVSRNRYWGSTIPVWVCDTCDERECFGSRTELQGRSGVWLDDLHKHFVDEVEFACRMCSGTMRRTPEVLDTWYDSGSMPFAQLNYPFANQERFEQHFPADFIAEGLDQTRGWFYTLLILSTAIFDTAPFQNCVVTGMILADDGRKMSKSLRNYPDPTGILDATGADALRAYLIDSPVVRADPLRFSEAGVRAVVRSVLLPLWNAYSFFTTYAAADAITAHDLRAAPPVAERPEIDRWLISMLQSLVRRVNDEMEAYRLFNVIPPVIGFVEHLTNWYIRRSRRRFWAHRGTGDERDKLAAFATLHEVLVTFTKVAAPVLPFVTEEMYQSLARTVDSGAPESVHHCDYPLADTAVIDEALEEAMAYVRSVVNLGHGLRRQAETRTRQPLGAATVVTRDAEVAAAVTAHLSLIAEELNVRDVAVHSDEEGLLDLSAKANFKALGPRLGPGVRAVAAAIEALDQEAIIGMLDGGTTVVAGETITAADIVVARSPRSGTVVANDGPITVALDTTVTEELRTEGLAREAISRIQAIRRTQDLNVTDRVAIVWESNDADLITALEHHTALIAGEVLATSFTRDPGVEGDAVDVAGKRLRLSVSVSR